MLNYFNMFNNYRNLYWDLIIVLPPVNIVAGSIFYDTITYEI